MNGRGERDAAYRVDDGALCSPGVGRWTPRIRAGDAIVAGSVLGELAVLGRRVMVVVPHGAAGSIIEVVDDERRQRPIGFGDVLCRIGRAAPAVTAVGDRGPAPGAVGTGFRAPSSGRFYSRPAPGKAPFVAIGDVVAAGQTICLLEVMKSFHRVAYAGPPTPARVTAVLVRDEADVAQGDVLFSVEEIGG